MTSEEYARIIHRQVNDPRDPGILVSLVLSVAIACAVVAIYNGVYNPVDFYEWFIDQIQKTILFELRG